MMVLCTSLVFLAIGSPSTSPGDLELVRAVQHITLLLKVELDGRTAEEEEEGGVYVEVDEGTPVGL